MSADLEERFCRLADAFEAHLAEERAQSNPYKYLEHESFEGVLRLGRPAVPLVVERYREGSLFWGAALARLTGVSDFGDGVTGNLKETRRRWLSWWEENHERFR